MNRETRDRVEREIKFREKQGYNVDIEKEAYNFVTQLMTRGINLKNIFFNDFNCCPQPVVYVKGRPYKRFSKFDLYNCIRLLK